MPVKRAFLIRHGETASSLSGQHTSITDVALTENGRAPARQLAPILAKAAVGRILASPMQQAHGTERNIGVRTHSERRERRQA
jgi:broad specificity phosphatase PhoE